MADEMYIFLVEVVPHQQHITLQVFCFGCGVVYCVDGQCVNWSGVLSIAYTFPHNMSKNGYIKHVGIVNRAHILRSPTHISRYVFGVVCGYWVFGCGVWVFGVWWWCAGVWYFVCRVGVRYLVWCTQ